MPGILECLAGSSAFPRNRTAACAIQQFRTIGVSRYLIASFLSSNKSIYTQSRTRQLLSFSNFELPELCGNLTFSFVHPLAEAGSGGRAASFSRLHFVERGRSVLQPPPVGLLLPPLFPQLFSLFQCAARSFLSFPLLAGRSHPETVYLEAISSRLFCVMIYLLCFSTLPDALQNA